MDAKNTIHLAESRDPDAFCRLYEEYKDKLYRYAVYRLGNRQDAEDAVSDCLLDAYRRFGSLRDPAAFPAWIFKILSTVCAKRIARQIADRQNRYVYETGYGIDTGDDLGPSGSAGGFSPVAAGHPDDDPEAVALRIDLQQALEQLSLEEKEVVLLSMVAGFSSKEIAGMTGSRPGTVRSKLSRSLKKMRAYLEGE